MTFGSALVRGAPIVPPPPPPVCMLETFGRVDASWGVSELDGTGYHYTGDASGSGASTDGTSGVLDGHGITNPSWPVWVPADRSILTPPFEDKFWFKFPETDTGSGAPGGDFEFDLSDGGPSFAYFDLVAGPHFTGDTTHLFINDIFASQGTGYSEKTSSTDLVAGTFDLTRAIWVKQRVEATAMRVKVWMDGDPEPAGWSIEVSSGDGTGSGAWNLSSGFTSWAPVGFVNGSSIGSGPYFMRMLQFCQGSIP